MLAVIFSPALRAVFDLRQHRVHFSPVRLAGRLDVINLGRDSSLPADPQQLVDRFEQLVPFAPHVRDVFALIFRGDFAELDQLLGLGVKRRRINQRRADPERARFHFLADQLAHLLELLRRRLFVFEANDVIANRGRADERSDVAGNAALLQITQIFRERVPLDLVFDVSLLAHDRALSSGR